MQRVSPCTRALKDFHAEAGRQSTSMHFLVQDFASPRTLSGGVHSMVPVPVTLASTRNVIETQTPGPRPRPGVNTDMVYVDGYHLATILASSGRQGSSPGTVLKHLT